MGALRFVIVFMGIVIKGCKESPTIMTILIILSGIAAFIFVPYWVGLLSILVIGNVFPPPVWAGGLLCMLVISMITIFIVGIYLMIHECVKNRMRRR
jgi:nicotinamide riboside transporter PnuC